jgi:hypothetical protein
MTELPPCSDSGLDALPDGFRLGDMTSILPGLRQSAEHRARLGSSSEIYHPGSHLTAIWQVRPAIHTVLSTPADPNLGKPGDFRWRSREIRVTVADALPTDH